MRSIWSLTSDILDREERKLPNKAEVVIIGGGMAGILTAYLLQNNGISCIVLEASGIGCGQTRNTTAKVTVQHGLIYHNGIEKHGRKRMEGYVAANLEAINCYRGLIRDKDIQCGWQECSAYLYTCNHLEELEQEAKAAQSLGIHSSISRTSELPFPVVGTLGYDRQAMFHPLQFLEALAGEVCLKENCKVVAVKGNQVITENGEIWGEKIVFATHYPFLRLSGGYFLKLHQERSYCTAVKNTASKMKNMYYGIDKDGLSFRPYEDYILIGGYGHRTGEMKQEDIYNQLKSNAQNYYPECEIEAQWSAQDCVTLDHIPYIGQYSARKPDWYIATGFGKWGMTSSMVAANMISDLICKGESPYEEVFLPQRLMKKPYLSNLWKQGAYAVKSLGKNLWRKAGTTLEQLSPGQADVIKWNGKRYGAYRDEKGACFLVSLRCPHLGCQLEWNLAEKSWDCPCHGSRFHYDGTLIDNPAIYGLEEVEQV